MTVDLSELVAIDVHVHAERNANEPPDPVTSEYLAAAARYFGGDPPLPTAAEVADYYRERKILAVIFNIDDEAGMGRRRLGSEEILEAARANPDVLIPFAASTRTGASWRAPGTRADRGRRRGASSSIRPSQAFSPTTATSTRSTR